MLAIPTAWAVAETGTSSSGSSGERVVRLHWTITEARTDDIGPAGDSSGDTFQAAFRLTGYISAAVPSDASGQRGCAGPHSTR